MRSVRFLYEEESSLPADGRAKRDFPPPPFLRKALGTATTLAHSPKYRCSTLLAAILDVSHSVHLAVSARRLCHIVRRRTLLFNTTRREGKVFFCTPL